MPYKHHYLDLGPNYTDENGDPLIRITWDYSDNDHGIHEFLLEKHAEILREMRATHIIPFEMPEHYTGHLAFQHNAGGAIMGSDPETSAVNKYLQMRDKENVFVCGASASPHFGVSNPTLTAGALTYHATEEMFRYLKERHGLLV